MTTMRISSLHLLLTFQCTLECDHCFVWGSPQQRGTMTLAEIDEILEQAEALGTVESVYFEGGEPFLYYPILVKGAAEAAARGLQAGVVTNGYWATDLGDALAWLRPLQGLIQDLSVSSDLYHGQEMLSQRARLSQEAARQLGIAWGTISVAQPDERDASLDSLMFRGRAAETLAPRVPQHPWRTFTECPYENLLHPGRVHIDPLGYVHVCQGIALGNLFRRPLTRLLASYEADADPIVGPLASGGPAALAERYGPPGNKMYADACHLCYETRVALRQRFPDILTPDHMYGQYKD